MKMDSEKDEIRIDIKAIGGSIGRRAIPNRPNVGKNPKDGDGDGFVVDLTTGLDNVPHNPRNQIDGSGSADRPMVAGREVISPALRADLERMMRDSDKRKRRNSERADSDRAKLVERISEEEKRKKRLREGFLTGDLTPQEEADQLEEMLKEPTPIDGDINGNRRREREAAQRYIRYVRNGGTDNYAEWAKRNLRDANGNRLAVPTKEQMEALKPKPFSLLPKPDKKTNNRFDDADSEEIFKQILERRAFGKKLNRFLREDAPMSSLPPAYQRRDGQTVSAHIGMVRSAYNTYMENYREMADSLRRRGYDNVESALTDYQRSKKSAKSLSPLDAVSDHDGTIRIIFEKE